MRDSFGLRGLAKFVMKRSQLRNISPMSALSPDPIADLARISAVASDGTIYMALSGNEFAKRSIRFLVLPEFIGPASSVSGITDVCQGQVVRSSFLIPSICWDNFDIILKKGVISCSQPRQKRNPI